MKPIILNIRVRIDTIDSHFANSDPTFTRSKRSNDRKEGADTICESGQCHIGIMARHQELMCCPD